VNNLYKYSDKWTKIAVNQDNSYLYRFTTSENIAQSFRRLFFIHTPYILINFISPTDGIQI